MPQCNLLHRYFCCLLPEDTINVEVTVRTMQGTHTFKSDHTTQVISCGSWSSRLHLYPSLAKKMQPYLELKDQVVNPPNLNLTYPATPDTPVPQKPQAHRRRTTK